MKSNRNRFRAIEKLVMSHFRGDYIKTELWFAAPNPAFGGLSPNLMIRAGRDDTIYQWVKAKLEAGCNLRIRGS